MFKEQYSLFFSEYNPQCPNVVFQMKRLLGCMIVELILGFTLVR